MRADCDEHEDISAGRDCAEFEDCAIVDDDAGVNRNDSVNEFIGVKRLSDSTSERAVVQAPKNAMINRIFLYMQDGY